MSGKLINQFIEKHILKDHSEYDKKALSLFNDEIKVRFICSITFVVVISLPAINFLAMAITRKNCVTLTLFFLAFIFYDAFIFYLIENFKEPINCFIQNCTNILFCKKYALKGKAISEEEFSIIKLNDSKLYRMISYNQASTYCYSICFNLLKLLKSGEFHLIAIRQIDSYKDEINSFKDYTMHAVYVKNDWCFDTFSNKQLPYADLLEILEAKEYKTISYSDIKEISFEEFKLQEGPSLKEWASKNNTFQHFYGYLD